MSKIGEGTFTRHWCENGRTRITKHRISKSMMQFFHAQPYSMHRHSIFAIILQIAVDLDVQDEAVMAMVEDEFGVNSMSELQEKDLQQVTKFVDDLYKKLLPATEEKIVMH